MKNFVSPGNVLTLTAPTGGAVGGLPVLVGSMVGVAAHDAAQGEEVEVHVGGGVFDLAKVSAQAWTAGAPIYWDNSGKVCTSTASTHKQIGFAAEAAANPSATGRVRLILVHTA